MEPSVGAIFGEHYQLDRCLGQGGMGVVWAGRRHTCALLLTAAFAASVPTTWGSSAPADRERSRGDFDDRKTPAEVVS